MELRLCFWDPLIPTFSLREKGPKGLCDTLKDGADANGVNSEELPAYANPGDGSCSAAKVEQLRDPRPPNIE